MTTLTISRNPDLSAHLRLTGNFWNSYSLPTGGRFQVILINLETGERSTGTSASTAEGGVNEARKALVARAQLDGVDTTSLTVVIQ
jgi:hypothetical protein